MLLARLWSVPEPRRAHVTNHGKQVDGGRRSAKSPRFLIEVPAMLIAEIVFPKLKKPYVGTDNVESPSSHHTSFQF